MRRRSEVSRECDLTKVLDRSSNRPAEFLAVRLVTRERARERA
jgi:hypothetical protein